MDEFFTLKAFHPKAKGSTECHQTRSRTLGTHLKKASADAADFADKEQENLVPIRVR
jgi:cytochrome c551/c552